MNRQRRTFRVIAQVDGVYVDKTVVAVVGDGRDTVNLREVVHGIYGLIKRMSGEALEGGFKPPKHDKVFIDPSDFTFHYLKRIR